jgi:hypothetical protein
LGIYSSAYKFVALTSGAANHYKGVQEELRKFGEKV